MTLKERITSDTRDAMRARAAAKLSTLRLLQAAIKQREVDERRELADADVVVVIERMLKQRRDSIEQFTAGRRLDLADAERAEVAILEAYLPPQMSAAEIDAAIDTALVTVGGATGPAALGKVMGADKANAAGRADMGAVSARIKATLGA